MQSVAVASVVAAPPYSRAFVTQTSCRPSSFRSVSLYLPIRPLSLPFSSATVRKPPCVLNDTSTLGGLLLTLTQNDHGEHFNPNNLTPGVLGDESRHADDLGNLNANEASIVDNQISLSGPNAVNGRAFVVDELDDNLGEGWHELRIAGGDAVGGLAGIAAVPKKRTSKSKTRIRKNYWKRKGYQAALKALSLAKSLYSGKSKSFMTDKLKE